MLCTEIILPITPAAEFTDAVRIGLRPSALAVTTCRLPKQRVGRRVAAGQEHAQPADDRAEERKRRRRCAASASPSVDVMPE